MATEPGEMPTFDFGPERAYNAELIAEQVVWPLVNKHCDGDWRQESEDKDVLTFSKRKMHQGRMLYVELAADCEKLYIDDDQPEVIRTAMLYLEEVAIEPGRTILLEAARIAFSEGTHESAGFDEWLWPDGDESHFVVKKCAAYLFDTDGDWDAKPYRRVEGPNRQLSVPLSKAEESLVAEDKLALHDVEAIEAGCFVLNAPKAIIKAIQNVKDRPVFSY